MDNEKDELQTTADLIEQRMQELDEKQVQEEIEDRQKAEEAMKKVEEFVAEYKKQQEAMNRVQQEVEHRYRLEMDALIDKEYGQYIKKSCNKCYGTGREGYVQTNMATDFGVATANFKFPQLCRCVVKNYNKEHGLTVNKKTAYELLSELIDLSEGAIGTE